MTLARSECSAVLHTEVTQPAWWFSPGWCARGRWEDSRKTGWRFLKVQKWNHRATQRSQLWAFVHRRQKQRLTETSAPLVCRSAVPEARRTPQGTDTPQPSERRSCRLPQCGHTCGCYADEKTQTEMVFLRVGSKEAELIKEAGLEAAEAGVGWEGWGKVVRRTDKWWWGVDTGRGPPPACPPPGALGCPCRRAEGVCLPGGRPSGLSCLWPRRSPFRLWEESPCGPARALLGC